MSGILELLNSDMGKSIVNGVSSQTNQPADKTKSILAMAMPVLMTAMKRNASTPEGAEGLMGALNSSKHGGSILENLSGLFGNGVDDNVMNDGSKILGRARQQTSYCKENLRCQSGNGFQFGFTNP